MPPDSIDFTLIAMRLGVGMQAGRRWCLSGTPIQNSIDDLYSCFCFLRYHPYCKRTAFKSMLKDPLQDDPAKGAQLLQVCLKVRFRVPWLLHVSNALICSDIVLTSSCLCAEVLLQSDCTYLHCEKLLIMSVLESRVHYFNPQPLHTALT